MIIFQSYNIIIWTLCYYRALLNTSQEKKKHIL